MLGVYAGWSEVITQCPMMVENYKNLVCPKNFFSSLFSISKKVGAKILSNRIHFAGFVA
jgi:hypothetical protein